MFCSGEYILTPDEYDTILNQFKSDIGQIEVSDYEDEISVQSSTPKLSKDGEYINI